MRRWICLFGVILCTAAVRGEVIYGTGPFQNGTNSNLYQINPSTGAATLVGSTGFGEIGGLAFDSAGQLWGASPGTLYKINTTTGAATRVGLFGDSLGEGDMSFQPGTGKLFLAIASLNGLLNDELATVNTATAAYTIVGALGSAGRDTSGLAFVPDGRLFGIALRDASADQLIQIDPSTGAATAIGLTGTNVPLPTVAGLSWSVQTGRMYFSDHDSLYTVNLNTGLASLIGAHGVPEIAAIAVAVPEPAAAIVGAAALVMLRFRRRSECTHG